MACTQLQMLNFMTNLTTFASVAPNVIQESYNEDIQK